MSNVGHDKIQPLNAWFFNVKLCRNTSETTLPPPYSLSSPPSHIILSSKLGSSKASPIIPLHFSTRLDCYADTAFIFKKSHSRHSTISFTHFQGELRLISVCQTDGRGGVWNPHTKASRGAAGNVWLAHPSRGCNSSVTCTNLLLHKHPFHCRWDFLWFLAAKDLWDAGSPCEKWRESNLKLHHSHRKSKTRVERCVPCWRPQSCSQCDRESDSLSLGTRISWQRTKTRQHTSTKHKTKKTPTTHGCQEPVAKYK